MFLCSEGCSVQSLTRIIAHRPHNSHRPVQPTPLHYTFNLHRKNWLVRDHFLHFTFYLLLSLDIVWSENRESRSHQKSKFKYKYLGGETLHWRKALNIETLNANCLKCSNTLAMTTLETWWGAQGKLWYHLMWNVVVMVAVSSASRESDLVCPVRAGYKILLWSRDSGQSGSRAAVIIIISSWGANYIEQRKFFIFIIFQFLQHWPALFQLPARFSAFQVVQTCLS